MLNLGKLHWLIQVNTLNWWSFKSIEEHLEDTFCLTYGDGVSDIDINQVIALHEKDLQRLQFRLFNLQVATDPFR